ncbi:MAG: hypothetical protein RH946_18155 [Rhodospirillales bacterium]
MRYAFFALSLFLVVAAMAKPSLAQNSGRVCNVSLNSVFDESEVQKVGACRKGDILSAQLSENVVPELAAARLCDYSSTILIGEHSAKRWHWLSCVFSGKREFVE